MTRFLSLHQYMPREVVERLDTKRLNAELKSIGYGLNYVVGLSATGNNRLWLEGPEANQEHDAEAIGMLYAQAKRLKISLDYMSRYSA